MKPVSYKQEKGDTERLLCPAAPQGPARFQWELPSHMEAWIMQRFFSLCVAPESRELGQQGDDGQCWSELAEGSSEWTELPLSILISHLCRWSINRNELPLGEDALDSVL